MRLPFFISLKLEVFLYTHAVLGQLKYSFLSNILYCKAFFVRYLKYLENKKQHAMLPRAPCCIFPQQGVIRGYLGSSGAYRGQFHQEKVISTVSIFLKIFDRHLD